MIFFFLYWEGGDKLVFLWHSVKLTGSQKESTLRRPDSGSVVKTLICHSGLQDRESCQMSRILILS